jgi:hypothetical protein
MRALNFIASFREAQIQAFNNPFVHNKLDGRQSGFILPSVLRYLPSSIFSALRNLHSSTLHFVSSALKRLTPPNHRRKIALMANRKKKLFPAEIHAMRGSIKLNTGGKPFSEWMAELNREEKELEERRFQRLATLGKK